jgi:anti-anti-sigma regulatory factor
MTDLQMNKDRNQVVVVLRGDLTVERAGELKQILQNAVASSETVIISFEGNLRIDVSFLQLVCSAHRSALNAQKNLKLASTIPQDLMELIHSVGYTYHTVYAFTMDRERLMCNGGEHE